MAMVESPGKASGEQPLSHVTTAAERQFIDKELRENGVKVNTDEPGLAILKYVGLEMEVSSSVGRARFFVNERSCQVRRSPHFHRLQS